MEVVLTRTDSGIQQVGSRLIRAFEGGLSSHCGVICPDGRVAHATWPQGVVADSYESFTHRRSVVAIASVKLPDEHAAYSFVEKSVHDRTDYGIRHVVSFLLWRDIASRKQVSCSSFVLRACLAGGAKIQERHDRFGVRHLSLWLEGYCRTSNGGLFFSCPPS